MRTWPQTYWSLRIHGINPYDTNLLHHHQPIRELYTSLSHTCDSLNHFTFKKKKKKKGSLFWNLLGNLDLLSRYDPLYGSVINAAYFVVQLVKNLPAVWDPPVWFLSREDSPGEGIGYPLQYSLASLVAHLVKNQPAMWETWVRSLGWEGPLEKWTAIYSGFLA